MPYTGPADQSLPGQVQRLPQWLRELWVEVFNETHGRRPEDEGRAFRAAWAAVHRASEQCARCHEQMGERFLGGNAFGMETHLAGQDVATCADCHGYHTVLPTEDPASPVNELTVVLVLTSTNSWLAARSTMPPMASFAHSPEGTSLA